MKYLLLSISIFGIAEICTAQQFTNPNLQGIVNAERAFAAMAKEKNTRDAFLSFLADDAITFGPEGPTNGIRQWEPRPVDENILSWYPTFVDIAASGDFGYDFGPWEFRPNKTDKDPVAVGHFITVWKKNKEGVWKVALDIGISHEAREERDDIQTPDVKSQAASETSQKTFTAEGDFNKSTFK